MKIEIDLAALGVHYDADGDMANTTLEQAIVAAAAEKLIGQSTAVTVMRNRVVEIVDAVARERIAAVVDEILSGPIQLTTPWGEKVAPVTTVREIVRKALEDYLNTKPRRDAYSSSNRDPQNMQELIEAATKNVLTKELMAEINKVKADINGLIRDKAVAAAADAIAKG